MADLDLARLVVGVAFLAAAAVSDLRQRRVRDELWIVLVLAALAILVLDLLVQGADPVVALVVVPTAVLALDPLIGPPFRTDEGWRFPAGSIAAYVLGIGAVAYGWWDLQGTAGLTVFVRYLTAPVMMLVFRGMYELHLLKGGADAKGMIAIAAIVPTYPDLPPLPLIGLDPRLQDALRVLFPFSLLVLLNAALLFLVAPLAFLAYNASRGNAEFPEALVGYKVPVDKVPRFAWFMDQVIDGEHVRVYFPTKRQDRELILRGLRRAGFKDAWVTPQLPFMVPLAIAYVLSFVIGNPLMGLLQAVT